MKRLALALLLASCAMAASGFDVTLPNEIPAYKDLNIVLNLEPGLKIDQARFYLLPERRDVPQYAIFKEKDGVWSTVIPSIYLRGDELMYYVQIRTAKGEIRRFPELGTRKARLLPDSTPPSLKVIYPDSGSLVRGQEQMIVCRIEDESEILTYEISYRGKPIVKSALLQNILSFFLTPAKEDSSETLVVVNLTDAFGNKAAEELSFALQQGAEPAFDAEAGYVASLDAEYNLAIGETANTTDLGAFFADLTHDVNLDYEFGAWTKLKAGPLRLQVSATLADEISVFDIPQAYPNSWIADFQNIMNLWHPWNFADEFDYSGEVPRRFYNGNEFLLKLSLFDPGLSYAFGDQKLSYQKETIKDFRFRGSSAALNTPFLDLSVAKGLADLGLYQEAWPLNFFGLQFGLSVYDYWWLQTNISFISSLQGRYADIASTGVSPIGVLYDLADIKPQESLVFGLDMGTDNAFFKLSGGIGLTLFTDDAGSILDADQLAEDIKDNPSFGGLDITPYLGYVDTVSAIFPVLDYFPLTSGLTAAAISRNLWGITYGGDLEVPDLGLEGWFHKTDGSYKSLGAAVDTDVVDIGGSLTHTIADFDLFLGYTWLKDNVPDILFNDILPLFGMAVTADPSEYDISNISNIVDLSLGSPSYGAFGDLLFTYNFEWIDTNAAKLAALIADGDDAAAAAAARAEILGSEYNDSSLAHTAGLKWKSGRLKLGDFIATLGAKTEDAFVTYTRIDGADSAATAWEFGYGLDGSLQYDRYKLALAFEHEWTTDILDESTYAYDLKFTLLKSFFDTLTASLSLDQSFITSSPQEWELGGIFTLGKRFGALEGNARIAVNYLDSLVDDSLDSLTAECTVSGGISL